jgi:hypothetical protein
MVGAPLLLAQAADNSGGWVLGNAGVSSCTTVCSSIGKPCNAASMQAVNTISELENVNARLGSVISCAKYTSPALKYNPSVNPASGYCNFNGTQSTCGSPTVAVPSSVRRMCCCQASGCLLTSPVRFVIDITVSLLMAFMLSHRPMNLKKVPFHVARPSTAKCRNGQCMGRARQPVAPE